MQSTDWSNTNQAGNERGPLYCPRPITALIAREQAGFGLVDLKLGFLDENGVECWTGWLTGNPDGVEKHPIRCADGIYAAGLQAREQRGYGLIDIRLIDSNGDESPWATQNPEGVENPPLSIPDGNCGIGITAREEYGYGLINIRMHYQQMRADENLRRGSRRRERAGAQ